MSTSKRAEPDTTSKSNAEWLADHKRYRIQSRAFAPAVLARGEGSYVWDVEGTRYLDYESGQFCMSAGHSHPAIAETIREQIGQLMQTGSAFVNPHEVQLARKLAEITPDPLQKTYFCSTGTEANECALRMAKKYTGRWEVVGLIRGYHGRSMGVFGVSTAQPRVRAGYGPLPVGITHIPAPYTYRCKFGDCSGGCRLNCVDYAEEVIERTTSGQPAVLMLESVLGAGGVIVPSPEWARAIASLCRDRGILTIDDEALVGLGRTGRWFGFEHLGIVPDIVTMAKALGGGLPLGAMITSAEIADKAAENGYFQSSSHASDPILCATGLRTVRLIEELGLLANAERMGRYLLDGFTRLMEKYEIVGDVRGCGLLLGMEIVRDKASKAPAPDVGLRIAQGCLKRGLIVGGVNVNQHWRGVNVIRFGPPLSTNIREADEALNILEDSIRAALP